MFNDIEKSFSFLRDMVKDLPERYYNNEKEIQLLDKEQQDLLHAIEFVPLNAYTGYKLSKQIKDVRERRRVLKDENELLEPIIPLLKRYRRDLQNMNQVLGVVRKIQNNQETKSYNCRVRKDLQASINSGKAINI